MECPNQDCKKVVDGHNHTLYGKDGMGGVVACVKNKLSRSTAVMVAIGIIGSAGGVTVYGLDSLKQDRVAVTENKENIATMNAELEYIKVMVEENHNNLEDIKNKMDEKYMTPKELKKLIKDAVKEGSR